MTQPRKTTADSPCAHVGLPAKVWVALLAALAGLLAFSSAAHADASQERLVKNYLLAAGEGDKSAVFNSFLSSDVDAFRARVMKALDAEAAQGQSAIRERLFGSASSLEELRRLTPPNFLLAITRRLEMPLLPAKQVDVLGILKEDGDTVHGVARIWPDKERKKTSRLALVTLRRFGEKEWRIGLPEPFLARVDAALEGSGLDRASIPEKPETTNSPEMLQLLDAGTQVLRDGNCASFFTVYMSPSFRSSKTETALKSLIQQCERNIDTREMYASALEIAKRSSPEMSEDGKRAVYDMRGQGLPFESYSIEKIGDRWYIAE
jgi:hypothetical protein